MLGWSSTRLRMGCNWASRGRSSLGLRELGRSARDRASTRRWEIDQSLGQPLHGRSSSEWSSKCQVLRIWKNLKHVKRGSKSTSVSPLRCSSQKSEKIKKTEKEEFEKITSSLAFFILYLYTERISRDTTSREGVPLLGRGATSRERRLRDASLWKEYQRIHLYKYRVLSFDNYRVKFKFY